MSTAERIRVAIIDDNAVLRVGLGGLLRTEPLIDVVGEAADGRAGIALVEELKPDVTLCDIRMPVLDGLAVAEAVASRTRLVVLTTTEDPQTIRAAMRSGACGYLVYGSRSPEEIISAVLAAARGSVVLDASAATTLMNTAVDGSDHGDHHDTAESAIRDLLSEREAEIMDLVAKGLRNREVALQCYVAEKTVKNNLNRIFSKLGVTTRAEAMALWLGARESAAQSGPTWGLGAHDTGTKRSIT